MKMISACSFIFMQIKVIFIRMVSHLDSLWNRGTRELGNGLLRFVVGTCVFLSHSSVLPPELHRGKKCGCWLLVSLTKGGCCSSLKEEIVAFSKKENTISKSSDKTSSTRGSSDAMFLVDMICTQTPAHWHPKIPIKWYGSIYFVS